MGGQAKDIAGYVEKVRLYPGGILIRAKLDTGAKTSSLNATHLKQFRRDGRRWVRFDLTNWKGRTSTFEAPLLRVARIKRHFGRSQRRPVVRMGICLGDVYGETEVNLVDRSGYNYQMLVGRRFLDGRFIVDPDLHFTLEPTCPLQPRERQ